MNSGLIFLAGGNMLETASIDKVFFSLHDSNDRILYIPIALGEDKHESCIEWFRSLLLKHCSGNTPSFDAIKAKENVPDLVRYKSVYIGGGNTYDLLNYLYIKKLNIKLAHYLQHGGIIYGGSAGAMTLGEDIRTAKEENLLGSTMHGGLHILGKYSVFCHYQNILDVRISEFIHETGGRVIAIPNDGGVIIDLKNKHCKQFGAVYLFENVEKTRLTRYSQIYN